MISTLERYGIYIAVVDDDAAVRHSLKLLIQVQNIEVRTYASCLEFLEDEDYLQCCCLVLDVRLPGISGLQLQQRLSANSYVPPIIFISGHADVPMAVQAMRDGAIDFLQKPFPEQVLLDRIEQATHLYATKLRQRISRAAVEARFSLLTQREKEVMTEVCAGNTNKNIGTLLGISVKTVEQHRAKVMEKLRVSSLAELVHLMESQNQISEGTDPH